MMYGSKKYTLAFPPVFLAKTIVSIPICDPTFSKVSPSLTSLPNVSMFYGDHAPDLLMILAMYPSLESTTRLTSG